MPWGMEIQKGSAFNRKDILAILKTPVDSSLEGAITDLLRKHEGFARHGIRTHDLGIDLGQEHQFIHYFIGAHSSLLSPAMGLDNVHPTLGGCRIKIYESENAAKEDVRSLARGMTYKWATLNEMFMRMFARGEAFPVEVNASRIGGGKSVVYIPELTREQLADYFTIPQEVTPFQKELLKKLAVCVKQSKGKYIFAPDMSTNFAMMDFVKTQTDYVCCLSEDNGGSGDPSVITAEGVYHGMKAAVLHRNKKHTLKNLTIGIEGLGKVGSVLLQRIVEEHPDVHRLVLTDKDNHAVSDAKKFIVKYQAEHDVEINHLFVEPDDFFNQYMNVYSPNARGQVLTSENVEKLAAKGVEVIAGGANNQYPSEGQTDVDDLLFKHRITYAPDYVINCGGILNVVYELPEVIAATGDSYHRPRALLAIRGIHDVLYSIFEASKKRALPSRVVADTLVHEHLARVAAHPKGGGYTAQTIAKKASSCQ